MSKKKTRKTLGRVDAPHIVSLMRLIETQSKATIAEWCMNYAEAHILPIFERRRPNDGHPRLAIAAARNWFDGKKKFPEVRNIILNECHASARELGNDPSAQAAARACGQASACCHAPAHSLGLAFYGAAAVAYDRIGTNEKPEAYDKIFAEECAKMEAALRTVSAENEP
ncbi:MAG: hypothetical protein LBP79_04590 [Clostridiales bacterium]|jgi:hypothetical protein|nr:hypothetical protein [Clostridiales bacterium]